MLQPLPVVGSQSFGHSQVPCNKYEIQFFAGNLGHLLGSDIFSSRSSINNVSSSEFKGGGTVAQPPRWNACKKLVVTALTRSRSEHDLRLTASPLCARNSRQREAVITPA